MIKRHVPKDDVHRRRLPHLVSLLLACSLVAAACGGSDVDVAGASTQTDDGAFADFPQLSASTLDGGQIDFGSLEGQDSILWFWAPW